MVKKNKEYIVNIIDNGYEGEGIAKIDNFTIFIPNAIKGEIVKILIVKVLSSHAFGKIIEIINKSSNRIDEDCDTYKRCGGCNLRHIKYEETLKMKQNIVQNLVNKVLENKVQVDEVLGMKNPYYYRNKLQFPVGLNKNGKPQMGIFAKRTHEIIPIQKCMIQNEKAQMIAKSVFKFLVDKNIPVYDEKSQKGLVRHIIIKVGIKTNEYMCVLVLNGRELKDSQGILREEELKKCLKELFPELKTIVINYNMQNTNVILGEKNRIIDGKGYIKDILGEFEFKISPLSFYQINPIQTEKLYMLAMDLAKVSKDDIVFDLYCGIGTISLFMSKYAKKVYGIEIVQEAVKMAKENADNNNVNNVEFISGDVKEVLKELIYNKKIIPNVVIIDPPRKGLDINSIQDILNFKPQKIVYISCNPATLVRDLNMLESIYKIERIVPIDMFPFTSHVECVAVLQLRQDR